MGAKRYEKAMKKLKVKTNKLTANGESVQVEFRWKMPTMSYIYTTYDVFGDGKIMLSMRCKGRKNLSRYGFTFELNEKMKGIKFYGRGPHENYIDRKYSSHLGVYEGVAEDFCHDYLHPQENGNRTDMRNLTISGGGLTLKAEAVEKPFEASVHPYTLSLLKKATHANKLARLPYLTVNIDGGQRGVGGDIPALALLKPQYKLKKGKEHTLKVLLFKKDVHRKGSAGKTDRKGF
jgi:beta-galactosidase